MLENNDLRLLTLASKHKITSATRQLKDKKLHYESGFAKWFSDVSSHLWPTKSPGYVPKETGNNAISRVHQKF